MSAAQKISKRIHRVSTATVLHCVFLTGAGFGCDTIAAQVFAAPGSAATAPAVFPVPAASGGAELFAPTGYSSSADGATGVPAPVLDAAIPEAPLPQLVPPAPAARTPGGEPVAPRSEKYIPAGWQAQRLGVRGKILVGASDLYSFEDFAAIVLSAGYEHVENSEPNYGVDRTAFAQRVGAAAAREGSQGIFTDMVFANLLREDPRYYVEGDNFGFVHRTLYSITRPFITRTDSGRRTVNGALLLGYAGAAALTPAYYPPLNRNFHDVASTYGSSIGGAALGFFVSEFSSDVLQALHLSHPH